MHVFKSRPGVLHLLAICGLCAQAAAGATYEVGPGKPLAAIGAVPWASLEPGDTVLIHFRPEPYKEKWVICRQGTASAPITVRGVPGPNGELPVIEGAGAVTAPGLNYWSEARGVLKIGGANIPADTTPRYIAIENLDIRGARAAYAFTGDDGIVQPYTANASPIFIEKGENIVVRNCRLHDGGNGFFVASSDAATSRDILVEGSYIYDNGNEGSLYEHNVYTAAVRITFQYNRLGGLRAGASGNNLKDRSAGLVVRYNWIEGGNRQLDLVEGEDSAQIRTDPQYRETHVYGNVLIEPPGAGNRQIVHYGGDGSRTRNYRNGTLYFYNNTVVSNRTDRTTLFRLSTDEHRCDARNNVFYTAADGSTLSLLDSSGVIDFQHNWIKPGWVKTFVRSRSVLNNLGGNVETAAPGFADETAQDYRLSADSPAVNAGGPLHPNVLPAHDVTRQYVKHQQSETRPAADTPDIGAYER